MPIFSRSSRTSPCSPASPKGAKGRSPSRCFRPHKGLALAALALAPLSACQASPSGDATAAAAAPAAATIPLTIESAGKRHGFRVEVARTDEEQARGLMYRERLGPKDGMIFPMEPPRPASFWMKNTLIPLDMIFIRADGSIARIAAMTVPHSLAPVESGEPVAAVLEIAGGRAAELGIKEGDRVRW